MAPYAVHRSIRGNYPRADLVVVLLVILGTCVAPGCSTIMGEQCDWSANGASSSGRGVTPVYLRCLSGRVRWSAPRGALRVVLRLPTPSTGKELRGCVRAAAGFAGARIFVEGPRSLTPLFAPGDEGDSQLPRCFLSRGGQAALYVEASDPPSDADVKRLVAEWSYDLQPIPRGQSLWRVISDECRPCSRQEMAHAFCTSDLVTRGGIQSVDDMPPLEQALVRVQVHTTLRHSTPHQSPNALPASVAAAAPAPAVVTYVVPRHCEPQHGPGQFVFMGRQRLGDLALTCVASLAEWAATVTQMNGDGSAHCVLNS